jgi:hypothetical protein
MQINVVTEQLMADRALFDLNQVLDVTPGTARTGGEFLPLVNIRGFTSLHAMRNGVRGVTMPDMTSIARVETIKGPAALIYGWTNPGGVINYSPRIHRGRATAPFALARAATSFVVSSSTPPARSRRPARLIIGSARRTTASRNASASAAWIAWSSRRCCNGNQFPAPASRCVTITRTTISGQAKGSCSSRGAPSIAGAIPG